MGKVIRRWAELDWSVTGVIRAQDIPFDEYNSIHDELTGRPLSPNSTYDNEIALFTWSGAESDPVIKQLKSSNTYINSTSGMGNSPFILPSEFVIRTYIDGAGGGGFIPLAGSDAIYGNLIPDDTTYSLGSSGFPWGDIYGGTIYADTIIASTAYFVQEEYVTLSGLYLTLNEPFTGNPFADGGISLNRGTSADAAIVWSESSQRWTAGLSGSTATILLCGDDLGLTWQRIGTTLSPINGGDDIHIAGAKIDAVSGYNNGIVISDVNGTVSQSQATLTDLSGQTLFNLGEFTEDPASGSLNDKDLWILHDTATSGKKIRYFDNGFFYTLGDSLATSGTSAFTVANTFWGQISGDITNQTDIATIIDELEDGWTTYGTPTYSSTTLFIVPDTADNASKFKIGRPVRFSSDGSNWYYAIVTSYASGAVTIAGAPYSASYVFVQTGDMSKAIQVDYKIAGVYADGVNSTLLYSDMDTYFRWNLGDSYLVNIVATHKVADTNLQPKVGVSIGGSANIVAEVQLTLPGTWVESTTVETLFYKASRTENIEIACTETTGNGDAEDLTVSCTFIVA